VQAGRTDERLSFSNDCHLRSGYVGARNNHFGTADRLAKQLNTASNSVDTLGQRARAMNRTLKMVEALPEGASEAALLGFDGDVESFEEEGAQAAQRVVGEVHSDIVLPIDQVEVPARAASSP
jgi:hypothetical protein